MNREQAKQLLPIITAFAKGKTIQFKRSSVGWVDTDEYVGFSCDPDYYRIKPKDPITLRAYYIYNKKGREIYSLQRNPCSAEWLKQNKEWAVQIELETTFQPPE